MSTQSDYVNAVQTRTAKLRSLMFAIDPVDAYTDRQKLDRAEVAARDIRQLGAMFDEILTGYVDRVEEECGPLSKAWRSEVKDCFAGLMSDVVSPAFKDLATRLGEEIEYRDPHASARLGTAQMGLTSGRAACTNWHWQIRLTGGLLDYWPSKDKWRYLNENHVGTFAELKAFIKATTPTPSHGLSTSQEPA